MNIESCFKNDTYNTPAETKRRVSDLLFLGSRWYFVSGYIGIIMRARSLAVKNKYDRSAWCNSSVNVLKLIEGCGGRFHLKGLDNIRSVKGPVVFISNHMSTLETFVFPCLIAPLMEVTFVVKESLVTHPLFGPVMRSRNPIVVNRKDAKEDLRIVMEKGKELLSKGISLIIFPQSTRNPEFDPELFNTLGVKLAKASGAQVVPVAIKTDFWGNGKIFKDVGPVDRSKPIYMTFGKPMDIKGNGKDEHKFITEFIIQNLKQWGGTIKESKPLTENTTK